MAAKQMKLGKRGGGIKNVGKTKTLRPGTKTGARSKTAMKASAGSTKKPKPAPLTPEEAEIADTVSKMKIFTIILFIVLLGIVIYVIAATLVSQSQSDADRRAKEAKKGAYLLHRVEPALLIADM